MVPSADGLRMGTTARRAGALLARPEVLRLPPAPPPPALPVTPRDGIPGVRRPLRPLRRGGLRACLLRGGPANSAYFLASQHFPGLGRVPRASLFPGSEPPLTPPSLPS